MKKIEEQLESIEEVLTHLVKKISGIEETAEKMTANNTTRNMLTDLKSLLTKIPSGQQFQAQMNGIQISIENLLKQCQVKHHHHFDIQSRGFTISALVLLVITGISVALAVGYHTENDRLEENDVKYRMIRQVNQGIVAWADSVYNISPGSAKQETLRQESIEMLPKDAEESLRRKQKEAENAENLLDEKK